MKSISVTVGILILTVFLSLSAPVYAGTANPYPVGGYVNYTDGTPADGELVMIYKAGDPLNNITAEVGSSYGASGYWKADLYNIPVSVTDGDTIVVDVLGKSSTFVVDTSTKGMGGQWVSGTSLTTGNGDGDNGDSSSGGGDNGDSSSGGGGDGTYPPGWDDDAPAPTPAATPAPTDAASEPTVASTEAPTDEEPTEAPTDEEPTETPTTETEMQTTGIPGFGAVLTVFAIAGLLVATYLVMRRRE